MDSELISGSSIALVVHSLDPTKDAISDSAEYNLGSTTENAEKFF